eukprot:9928038-Karenia_brevis.AAC.1
MVCDVSKVLRWFSTSLRLAPDSLRLVFDWSQVVLGWSSLGSYIILVSSLTTPTWSSAGLTWPWTVLGR